MTPEQMLAVLAFAAQVDGRIQPTELVVDTWHGIVHDTVSVHDALDAVRDHYGRTTDPLMPAHLNAYSKRVRARRIEALGSAEDFMADVDPDHPDWHAIRQERVHAAADGPQGARPGPRAITPPPPR